MATETNFGGTATPIFVGEDLTLAFTVTGESDITGWTISFAVGSVTKTSGGGGITMLTNVATVTLGAADTTALGPGAAAYRLRRTDSGNNTVLAYGQVSLYPS